MVALKQAVGSSLVGFGSPCLPVDSPNIVSLGVTPNVNLIYQLQEFGVYDPIVPYSYQSAWDDANHEPAHSGSHLVSNTFCPSVTTAAVARQFGIGFVLEQPSHPGPHGAVFDMRVGNEDLYRIPGSATATLGQISKNGMLPPSDVPGTPVPVTHPNPASWKLDTDASTPKVLRLRLTNLPGWQATIDGRPLQLLPFDGVMLQARIPSGRHTIELHYWPDSFTIGIFLAALAAIGLLVALVISQRRRRKAHLRKSPLGKSWPDPGAAARIELSKGP